MGDANQIPNLHPTRNTSAKKVLRANGLSDGIHTVTFVIFKTQLFHAISGRNSFT